MSDANRALAFLKNPGRVATVLKLQSHVMVGNEFLAEYARRHTTAVTVIPTAVDTKRFVPRPRHQAPRAVPVVGWIGSPTTYRYLLGIAAMLHEVATPPSVRALKVSGAGRPVEIPGVRVDEAPWSMAEEVRLFNGLRHRRLSADRR